MSKIKIEEASTEVLNEWNKFIDTSPQGTLYHHREWLKAIENHSKTRMVSFAAYKGEKLICLFPVFIKKLLNISIFFSPPPGCAVPYLGPVFLIKDMKPRDIESIYTNLVDMFDSTLREYGADIIQLSVSPELRDIRPFVWNNYISRPQYEYTVMLDQDIFSTFHNETRTKIRRAKKYQDLHIKNSNVDYSKYIVELTRNRYREQGINWSVNNNYVQDIMQGFNKDYFSSFCAEYGSEIITGMITYKYKNACYDWIGGINPAAKLSGVNELLHWSIASKAKEEGLHWYNLGGANTPHLSKSKSKYSPQLITYYDIYKTNLKGSIVYNISQNKWIKIFYKKILLRG